METNDIAAVVHNIECHRALLRARIDFLGTLCAFLDHCAQEASQNDALTSEVEHQRRALRQQLGKLILNLELADHDVFVAWVELAKELFLRQINDAFAHADELGQDDGCLASSQLINSDDDTIPLVVYKCHADMRKWDVVLGLKEQHYVRPTLN